METTTCKRSSIDPAAVQCLVFSLLTCLNQAQPPSSITCKITPYSGKRLMSMSCACPGQKRRLFVTCLVLTLVELPWHILLLAACEGEAARKFCSFEDRVTCFPLSRLLYDDDKAMSLVQSQSMHPLLLAKFSGQYLLALGLAPSGSGPSLHEDAGASAPFLIVIQTLQSCLPMP